MLFEPFVLRTIFAALAIALLAGSLGCFITWRRMVFLGDSLAHSALIGVVLGVILGIDLQLATLAFSCVYAILLLWLKQHSNLTTDSILGTLAHSGLAIGLIVLAIVNRPDINLHGYLFGDILTIKQSDLIWLLTGSMVVLLALYRYKDKLVLCAIHQDLARSEGVAVDRLNWVFTFLVTLTIAISLQIIGLLLITSLLIIPPAAARLISKSPSQMILFSLFYGVAAVLAGVGSSLYFDLPTGPAIVVAASSLFALTLVIRHK